MFNIGFSEAVIIFLVALIVLGPEKLPELGKFLARLTIEIRRGIEEIKRELEIEETEKGIKEAKKEIEEVKEEIEKTIKDPFNSEKGKLL